MNTFDHSPSNEQIRPVSPRSAKRGALRGATWAALVAVVAAAAMPIAQEPEDDFRLLEAIWEDASTLAPEGATTQPIDDSSTYVLSANSLSTYSLSTDSLTTDSLTSSANAKTLPTVGEDLSWVADLNGWVPNLGDNIDSRNSRRNLSGEGIDIALIDSGVTPVQGLDGADKIINGPDLSGDAGNPALMNLDLYGHGTHMAGIIAGNDGTSDLLSFSGIAPEARLVNVKVADGAGNTSMEQVVAGIEWVILNKNANGMNIRVLTLALGHDESDYLADPIAAALEEAWANGIVVVVAGGNNGNDSNGLDAPAIDPYVMAIAATDQNDPTNFADDTIATWSSSGNGVRTPDVAAPGRSIVSLRVPGSYADAHHPESRIGDRFAVASGTSQASAVMAGTVARLLEQNPTLTPDEVKSLFISSADDIVSGTDLDGFGRVRLDGALAALKSKKTAAAEVQSHQRAAVPAGFGTENGGWTGGQWTGASWSGASWSGSTWSGSTWSGSTWSGSTWSGSTWSGSTWSGSTWSGSTWSGASWS